MKRKCFNCETEKEGPVPTNELPVGWRWWSMVEKCDDDFEDQALIICPVCIEASDDALKAVTQKG